ncbi:MAG: ATP-binding protein [Tissierellales bacterium]|jgi:serine/threonine-protein kinase RsbW|nr:ATP-binding protein [Tissierellales bacterium]
MKEYISLKIPKAPEYVSLVRLNSSAVANTMAFDFEEIDDIKIAVAEACNSIIEDGQGEDSCIEICYEKGLDYLTIEIKTDSKISCQMEKAEDPLNQNLSMIIIQTIMDEVECIDKEFNGVRMTKRIGVDA